MMAMRPGSWNLSCPSDPRWVASGRSDSVGGFQIPAEAQEKIDELRKLYGDPPADLEWGYMKD